MSTDKAREEFDSWWADPAQAELRKSCSQGLAHHVWQASRAALCVELPPTITADDVAESLGMDDYDLSLSMAHMVNGAIAACGSFVKAAGVRVKA